MITIVYAGILGIVFLALSVYVMQGRMVHKVMLGDGANSALQRRVRMHGNFAEYTPIGLLLLFLVDYAGSSPMTVHILGVMLVAGRIAHALGLRASEGPSVGRAAGMLLTLLMILASSLLLLWKYFALQGVEL